MRRILKNKKAQIGETLTCFVAIILIFFIIVLFLTLTTLISGKMKLFGKTKVTIEDYTIENLEAQRHLINFLQSSPEIEDNSEFEKLSKDFIENLKTNFYPEDTKIWIKIYDIDKKIKATSNEEALFSELAISSDKKIAICIGDC